MQSFHRDLHAKGFLARRLYWYGIFIGTLNIHMRHRSSGPNCMYTIVNQGIDCEIQILEWNPHPRYTHTVLLL